MGVLKRFDISVNGFVASGQINAVDRAANADFEAAWQYVDATAGYDTVANDGYTYLLLHASMPAAVLANQVIKIYAADGSTVLHTINVPNAVSIINTGGAIETTTGEFEFMRNVVVAGPFSTSRYGTTLKVGNMATSEATASYPATEHSVMVLPFRPVLYTNAAAMANDSAVTGYTPDSTAYDSLTPAVSAAAGVAIVPRQIASGKGIAVRKAANLMLQLEPRLRSAATRDEYTHVLPFGKACSAGEYHNAYYQTLRASNWRSGGFAGEVNMGVVGPVTSSVMFGADNTLHVDPVHRTYANDEAIISYVGAFSVPKVYKVRA